MAVFLATMNPAHGAAGWARPGLAAYNAAYRRLAAEGLAGLIDTGPAWQALGEAERRRLIPDGLHPTPEGMRLVAVPAFAAALAPRVCTEPLPPQESG
jgi:lysophospholipase L1-like esterase